ncbi:MULTISPECIES: response regulator transcription factor [unclassified Paenibacillus]|uniref:response regulator transcription factor n=1 Tax=unclassified Paenibacillus TaxID=185978 RepID=UPI0027888B0D|nr:MULTISPECIES: response regulator transcription factor [unclassified Paenibacillus]MDQ0900736.1 two-component system response regulator ResD [Paenibacillus sp. V4I7]MDQ0920754.1 two-component system response regulator ResD [Paenibacillus sp. V4I5]
MKTILIVDDEEKIREVVASYLQNEGYATIQTGTGNKALELVRGGNVDLLILDLMLPDMSGEDVCRVIRQFSPVPVIMLTAKVSEDDRVQGLTLGADDYVVKPFSPRELTARVKAILRRTQDDTLLAEVISFHNDDLVIRPMKHEVYKIGNLISLTPNEYKLLLILAHHPNRTFTREELIEKLLGFDFEGDTRSIDQHVKNLRQKIESDPKKPKYIVTVFSVGYRFTGGESS